jgi:cytochrome c oxidase assembly protein subunit 11
MSEPGKSLAGKRNRAVALPVAAAALGMLGMAFAAVPLYRAFCAATGYGGTTQVSKSAPTSLGSRVLSVRFDTNIASGLPWTVEPEEPVVELRPGETKTVFFRARNTSDRATSGIAGYNVSPDQSGAYFNKISCFCFSEQRLDAGEKAEWPVVFYLDPSLEKDATMARVDTITLSYVLYPAPAKDATAGERKF